MPLTMTLRNSVSKTGRMLDAVYLGEVGDEVRKLTRGRTNKDE